MSPIKDKTGRIIGAATIARDITERKRIEESIKLDEARLEALGGELNNKEMQRR